MGDVFGMARSLVALADIAFRTGDPLTAVVDLREAIELSRSIGDVLTLTDELHLAVQLVIHLGADSDGARLAGALDAIRRARGIGPDPSREGAVEQAVDRVRGALGHGFDHEFDEGAQLDADDAGRLALEALLRAAGRGPGSG